MDAPYIPSSSLTSDRPPGDPDLSSPVRATKGFFRMLRGRVKLWENARFALADVPLDAAAASAILPFGMWPTNPARATLFIADYTKTSFTVPYKEAAVLVHVRTPLGTGLHCPWMVVDDDTALIYGRELLGYPKKLAQLTFEESDTMIRASVIRRGVRVLKLELRKGDPEQKPRPVIARKMFNVGGIGNATAFAPIWLSYARERVHEARGATAQVSIGDSVYDPLARLVRGEPVCARSAVIDILGMHCLLPVGVAGLGWFTRMAAFRYR
jgi:acetoacetate decarboxylase